MSVAPTQPAPQIRRTPLHETKAAPIAVPVPPDDASTARTTETAELHRWLRLLLPPFVISGAFFALAIGTGVQELIAPALFFGPMAIILAFIYLGLSSDSNSA
jgi:hypothetical protein